MQRTCEENVATVPPGRDRRAGKHPGPAQAGGWLHLAIFVAAVVGLAVLFFFNPSTAAFYPRCLFHEMTGLYCPGCGSTRALFCLVHGEWLNAIHENALAVLAIAVLGGMMLRRVLRPRPPVGRTRPRMIWILALVAMLATFGVLRNLPGRPFTWLAPTVVPDTR